MNARFIAFAWTVIFILFAAFGLLIWDWWWILLPLWIWVLLGILWVHVRHARARQTAARLRAARGAK